MTPSPLEGFRQFLLSPAKSRKSWAALVLVITVLTLFSPILFSKNLLVSTPDGDLANQFLGWRVFGFSELAKGHLTLWNPFIFCGAPFFAGFQSALLYPLNWTFLLLPPLTALNFSVALHIFLAGFFAYLWLAANRLSFIPALFGSFVFMFGGAFYAHVTPGHLTNLCAMAWIPLVFLSVEKLLESPNLQNLLIGSAILSFQLLAGHPQYFLYTIFFAVLYALALVIQQPSRWTRQVPTLLGLFGIGAALTTVQWLPGWEATREFGRDLSSNPESLDFFSLHPLAILSAVTPGFRYTAELYSSLSQSRLWWESCLFIGVIPFLGVLAALGFPENKPERKWVPFGLALLALLLALGPHTPLYPLLAKLPPFGFFRGSFKFAIFFQTFLSLLSARGLQAAWNRTERAPRFWALALLALLGMTQLFDFAKFCTTSFDAQKWLLEGQAARDKMAETLKDGRVYWQANNDRSMVLGTNSIWGDDPFPSKRLQAFIDFLPDKPATPAASPDVQVLNLTPVKMALTRLAFLLSQGPEGIQINPSPAPRFPRVTLVGGYRQAKDMKEALELIAQPGFNPQGQVVLEGTPDPVPVENGGKGQMTLKNHNSDWLEVTVETDKPQILLMTDNYANGWKTRAYPNSVQKNYQVMPGDVFARAIPLSAGTHHFDLTYEAPGFSLGKWISLLALVGYLLAWGGWVWRKAGAR